MCIFEVRDEVQQLQVIWDIQLTLFKSLNIPNVQVPEDYKTEPSQSLLKANQIAYNTDTDKHEGTVRPFQRLEVTGFRIPNELPLIRLFESTRPTTEVPSHSLATLSGATLSPGGTPQAPRRRMRDEEGILPGLPDGS